MLKGMIIEIQNTYNPIIKNQYNVKVLVISGQDGVDKFVYLDIRDPNFIKIMKRGMMIQFSEIFEISKNRFIHVQDIRILQKK